MSKNNPYDDDDFRAFVSNESRIRADDREFDKFSPENLLPDELDTDCMGNCFSDADPGL